ncbi:MAG: hypothetical protein NTV24_02770 [Candidatus Woesebacteria bacterium]|nr:hypothetical protein [Candidatus Woesebacteria bacterium]
MKRNFFIHLAFFVSVFILFSIIRGWLNFSYWTFWVGGVLGTIIPEADQLLYVFFINPQELTSQRIILLIKNRNFTGALRMLFETGSERYDLVFHSNIFLIISGILFVWILTSSGSVLGFGLALGLILDLLLDRLITRVYHRTS